MTNMVTRVTQILDDRVRLQNLTDSFHDLLIANGFLVASDEYGYPSVTFMPDDEKSLTQLLVCLADMGAAFAADVKDIAAPAALMEQIRTQGHYNGTYIECTFDGHEWKFTHV